MEEIIFREVWTEPAGVVISKLFLVYLFVTVCITSVRIVRLAFRLGLFKLKQKYLGYKENDDIDTIAEAALKKKFQRIFESSSSINTTDKKTIQIKLDTIETRFLHLWETNHAKVKATKALATMTIILSACIAFIGSYKICSVLMLEEIDRFIELAYWRDLFFLIMLGIIVSAYCYSSAFCLQGVLARRKKFWNLAKARFREDFFSTFTQE